MVLLNVRRVNGKKKGLDEEMEIKVEKLINDWPKMIFNENADAVIITINEKDFHIVEDNLQNSIAIKTFDANGLMIIPEAKDRIVIKWYS